MQEVFVRRSYLRHGLVVDNGAVVIDAGANIGLFSLQCLREAKRVKVGFVGVCTTAVYILVGPRTRNNLLLL